MANFKVGQRVRIIDAHPINARFIGRQGVIAHTPGLGIHLALAGGASEPGAWYGVDIPGTPDKSGGGWGFLQEHLAPLTDPKADEFIEGLKKLKPLHEEPRVGERTWVKVDPRELLKR